MVKRFYGREEAEADADGDREDTKTPCSHRYVAKRLEVNQLRSHEDDSMVGVRLYRSLHSQILRIREEDSLIGEDTVEFVSKFCIRLDGNEHQRVASVIVFSNSKPLLPASPLGGGSRRFTAITPLD